MGRSSHFEPRLAAWRCKYGMGKSSVVSERDKAKGKEKGKGKRNHRSIGIAVAVVNVGGGTTMMVVVTMVMMVEVVGMKGMRVMGEVGRDLGVVIVEMTGGEMTGGEMTGGEMTEGEVTGGEVTTIDMMIEQTTDMMIVRATGNATMREMAIDDEGGEGVGETMMTMMMMTP